ncbi:MAG: DUF3379 family protein, partial [Woeseiaceae bacterium]
MNCDDYKQAIGADPKFDGGAQHVAECESCQAYRREMLALDQTISRALAIDVPDLQMPELEEVDTEKVVSLESRRKMMTPVWFAAAATVLVAAFVGFQLGGGSGYDTLAEEVLAHVDHTPAALIPTDRKISDDKLQRVVPATIADLDHSAGLITFAETCPIAGNDVPHLVIQGKTGPITIMLLPNEKISEAISLNDEDSHGVILPVGDGSIA